MEPCNEVESLSPTMHLVEFDLKTYQTIHNVFLHSLGHYALATNIIYLVKKVFIVSSFNQIFEETNSIP